MPLLPLDPGHVFLTPLRKTGDNSTIGCSFIGTIGVSVITSAEVPVAHVLEGIRELETPAVIDAINTGGKHRSTCPRQPPVILELAVTDDNEQGLNKTLGWYK